MPKLDTCDYCGGQGQVIMRQGPMQFAQTCPKCHGEGKTVAQKCTSCHGEGYHEEEDTVTVSKFQLVLTRGTVYVSKVMEMKPRTDNVVIFT